MAFEIPSDLMVSVSGVRGRVGAGLTPEVVARFASAFGAYVREREAAAAGGAGSGHADVGSDVQPDCCRRASVGGV